MLVNLFLTDNCNLRCSYCYVDSDAKLINEDIADNAINFIFEKAKSCSVKNLGIVFSGGEPLLCFETMKAVVLRAEKQAKDLGNTLAFLLTTNGTLVTKEVIHFLSSHPFSVSLSIDGPQAVHDTCRKCTDDSGSFKKMEHAIEMLLDWNKLTVARMTFTPQTVRHLSESVRYLSNRGFQLIKPVPDFFDQNWDEDSFHQCEDEFERILDFISFKLSRNEPLRVITVDDSPDVCDSLRRTKLSPCRAGLDARQFTVAADGRLFPCSFVVNDENFVVGDVKAGFDKERLEEVYQGVDEKKRKSLCGICAYYSYCKSGRCIFVNYRLTGNLNLPSGFFCNFEQLMLKTKERYKKMILDYSKAFSEVCESKDLI